MAINNTPPSHTKERRSNLELYRILCMFMIVAHHYAGSFIDSGVALQNTLSANSLFLFLFGMWGKTGINCFVLITGYFMCNSKISLRKFLKLYLWIITYGVLIRGIFLITGYQEFDANFLLLFFPFTKIDSDSFASAFLVWWLFIPFLNVLVNNLDRKQHFRLIIMLLIVFSIYPFMPAILSIQGMNPICWFSTLFFIASYIRKYSDYIYKYESASFWGNASIITILISMLSVVMILYINRTYSMNIPMWYCVADSNKPFALLVSVFSFLCFNNIRIGYNKWINTIGTSTFGVLLIHTNGAAMRK